MNPGLAHEGRGRGCPRRRPGIVLGLTLALAACVGRSEPSATADLVALRASMDRASLDLAWRATHAAPLAQQDRPPGWGRLALAAPPYLSATPAGQADARRLNADLPAAGVLGEAPPFRSPAADDERVRGLLCLTEAIYYEAALEPAAGQAAVAQVILNRVRHPAFPHSICGVVYQGAGSGVGCQFTYVCDGARARRPVPALWRRAQGVAERALDGAVAPGLGAAIAYHADYVFPRWAPTLAKITQIGAHIFYRFPGPWGRVASLDRAYSGGERFAALNAPTPPAAIFVGPTGRPVVGVAAFHDHQIESGRRAPTPDEVAGIDAALLEMDKSLPPPPP